MEVWRWIKVKGEVKSGPLGEGGLGQERISQSTPNKRIKLTVVTLWSAQDFE